MMNHNGWMDGWTGGGGMWIWAVLIIVMVLAMLFMILNKRSNN